MFRQRDGGSYNVYVLLSWAYVIVAGLGCHKTSVNLAPPWAILNLQINEKHNHTSV